MGLGDWISNAFNDVKNWGKNKLLPSLKSGLGKIKDAAVSAAKGGWGVAKNIGTAVHDDIKGIANFAGKQIDKATDLPGRLLGDAEGLFKNPLIWIGGGILAVILLPKLVEAAGKAPIV